jgi:hypothetical protein
MISAERTLVVDSPASCSYSTQPHSTRNQLNFRLLRKWSCKPLRQPSGAVLRVSAEQQAASQSETQPKAERPQDIAGRPVADSTSYDMPVVCQFQAFLREVMEDASKLRRALETEMSISDAANGLRADVAKGIHRGGDWLTLW